MLQKGQCIDKYWVKPTPIPFALSAYRRDIANTPEQICRNFIVENDDSGSDEKAVMLLQRPGFDPFADLTVPVQALYASNNATAGFPALLAISGNSLYSLDGSTSTALGSIAGSDPRVRIVSNFDRVAIVADGCLWLYGASTGTTGNSFRQVTIPDGYQVVDVAMLDDYFIVAMSDGTYYWLVPGDDDFDGDTNALHFATAEAEPDSLVGVSILNGNIYFFGGDSIEVWQTSGTADQPFQRLPNQGFARGCLHRDTIQAIDNSIIWVGEDAKVYRVSNVPQKISTIGIDERLQKRTGEPSAWSFSYSGHLYYVLNIPGQGSFAYDISTQNWSEFASEGHGTWRAHVGTSLQDIVLCGDSQTGAIWKLSDSATDAGTLIRRTATASVVVVGRPVRNDDVSIDVGADASCTINLRWADAGEDLTSQPPASLQAAAGANVLTCRRLGQARQPWREFEIEITDPAVVRISSARLGASWH
jgi:hypothetical protein